MPGRPRGSGKPQATITVELGHPEAPPFYAGLRMYETLAGFDERDFTDLARITPHLSLAERRHLTTMPDERFRRWLVAGYICGAMQAAITEARAA